MSDAYRICSQQYFVWLELLDRKKFCVLIWMQSAEIQANRKCHNENIS